LQVIENKRGRNERGYSGQILYAPATSEYKIQLNDATDYLDNKPIWTESFKKGATTLEAK
jgi:hypothetical protein